MKVLPTLCAGDDGLLEHTLEVMLRVKEDRRVLELLKLVLAVLRLVQAVT